jgi:hypothetical protein
MEKKMRWARRKRERVGRRAKLVHVIVIVVVRRVKRKAVGVRAKVGKTW